MSENVSLSRPIVSFLTTPREVRLDDLSSALANKRRKAEIELPRLFLSSGVGMGNASLWSDYLVQTVANVCNALQGLFLNKSWDTFVALYLFWRIQSYLLWQPLLLSCLFHWKSVLSYSILSRGILSLMLSSVMKLQESFWSSAGSSDPTSLLTLYSHYLCIYTFSSHVKKTQ